jgi:hypothetical protein
MQMYSNVLLAVAVLATSTSFTGSANAKNAVANTCYCDLSSWAYCQENASGTYTGQGVCFIVVNGDPVGGGFTGTSYTKPTADACKTAVSTDPTLTQWWTNNNCIGNEDII